MNLVTWFTMAQIVIKLIVEGVEAAERIFHGPRQGQVKKEYVQARVSGAIDMASDEMQEAGIPPDKLLSYSSIMIDEEVRIRNMGGGFEHSPKQPAQDVEVA